MSEPTSRPLTRLAAFTGVALLLLGAGPAVGAVPDDPVTIAVEAQLFGKIEVTGASVHGAFVAFELGAEAGTIHNFTLSSPQGDPRRIFENLTIGGLGSSDDITITVSGSLYELTAPSGSLALHDNPAGVVMLRADEPGVTVSLDLALGMAATVEGRSPDVPVETIELVGQGFRGLVLAREGTITRQGPHITVELDAGGHLVFRALPELGVAGLENLEALLDAIKRSRVGAELSVVTDHGEALHDLVIYRPDITLELQEVRRNRISMEVAGIGSQGTVLVLQFARSTLQATAPSDLLVAVDEKTVEWAEGANGVLSANLGLLEEPLAYASFGERGGQVLLYLPHLSTYTVELGRVPGLPGTLDVASAIALGGAAAIVVGAALVLFHRRRVR